MEKELIEKRKNLLKFLDQRATMLYPNDHRICGIYAIFNNINGKIYIGKTNQKIFKYLRTERIMKLRKGEMHNHHLQLEFNKIGEKNFSFFIIEKILINDSSDYIKAKIDETINYLEVYFIDKFQANNREYGYNFEIGGTNLVTIDDIKKLINEESKSRDVWVYGELSSDKQISFSIKAEYIPEKRIKFPDKSLSTIIDMFIKQDHKLTSFEEYIKKFYQVYGKRENVQEHYDLVPRLIAQQIIKKFPETEII